MSNIWQVRTPSRRVISSEQALKKELLRQRGVDPGTVTSFFHPLYERDIHNPLLLADMQIAVDRIYQAINKGQRIIIYGDYDADGISSTAIITSTLLKLGAKVTPYLPHRTQEGYGLNAEVLKSITPEMDLLITMDCGITHYREIQALNIKGIDSIIVDHHTVPKKLPPAAAIVHPNLPNSNYPSKNLCAAGLAWKLSAALLAQHTASDEDDEKWLLDLAMLGTVADMVPLIGENRAITIFGLEVLRRTPRPGLRALVAQATRESQPLTATDIAFRVIPKINAAGRMDHPQPALELLLTTNEDRAQELAAQITSYNNQRQTVSKKILLEAENQADLEAPVLFAYNANWHAGVIWPGCGAFIRPL
jgi:single-stranded-DNA-specific exonuclease